MVDRKTGELIGEEPRFKTRVTIRNPFFTSIGFSYDTTVEVSYECAESELDDVADQARVHMQSELRKSREDGQRERDARNREKD